MSLIKQIKRGTLSVSKRLGVFEALRGSNWRRERLVILCYHGISLLDEHEWNPSYYMSPVAFERRLAMIRSSDYQVIPLEEGLHLLRRGRLTRASLSVTFDDGMFDFYSVAYPLLKKYDIPATVYLTTFYSDFNRPVFTVFCSYLLWKGRRHAADVRSLVPALTSPVDLTNAAERARVRATIVQYAAQQGLSAEEKDRYLEKLASLLGVDYDDLIRRRLLHVMSSDEVRSLAASGVDFQLHTHRHRTPGERELFLREIDDNRRRLTNLVGRPAVHFCYPSGVYRREFLPWLTEAGVATATTCDRGLASRSTEPLLLPRVVDGAQLSEIEFEGWLEWGLRTASAATGVVLARHSGSGGMTGTTTPFRAGVAKLIRRRSLAEVRDRGSQLCRQWMERTALLDQRDYDPDLLMRSLRRSGAPRVPATVDEWLAEFRRRPAADFFGGFENRARTLSALRSWCPDREHAVIATAERILEGQFDLLGHRDVRYRGPVDWHSDPIRQRRAPLQHWSRIPFLDASVVGDHKCIWELNRHQFLLTLGKAYWYSGEERYARGFAELLGSWLDANPPKRGINWASSLEIAYRSIAWIWVLHFFRESEHLTPTLFGRMLFHLKMNARHVRHFLSTWFSPNTHLTGEALGLFLIGVSFPEFAESLAWRRAGWSILTQWLPRHARADGVYVEQTTYYHRYTVDILQHAYVLGRLHGWPVQAAFDDTLSRLVEHLQFIARPDGTVPVWGDEDGGRLLPLDGLDPVDARGPFGVSAVLLQRADFAFAAGGEREALIWLLGPESPEVLQRLRPAPPSVTSRAFPDGGVYVMRDGWGREASVLSLDCGPHGFSSGGHAHADALALDATIRGQPLFVDAGTYTYTVSPSQRDRFRSSLWHNTVSIDGESSAVPAGPFSWKNTARCRLNRWHALRSVDYFDGQHDGYRRLPDPAVHRRIVLFIKGDYWIVRDIVSASATHDVELVYQCAPGIRVRTTDPRTLELSRADRSLLRLQVIAAGGAFQVAPVPMSPQYGLIEDAMCCRYALRSDGAVVVTSLLLPASGTADSNGTHRTPLRPVASSSADPSGSTWQCCQATTQHAR